MTLRRIARSISRGPRPAVVIVSGPEGSYSDGYPRDATADEFLASASKLLRRDLRR